MCAENVDTSLFGVYGVHTMDSVEIVGMNFMLFIPISECQIDPIQNAAYTFQNTPKNENNPIEAAAPKSSSGSTAAWLIPILRYIMRGICRISDRIDLTLRNRHKQHEIYFNNFYRAASRQ